MFRYQIDHVVYQHCVEACLLLVSRKFSVSPCNPSPPLSIPVSLLSCSPAPVFLYFLPLLCFSGIIPSPIPPFFSLPLNPSLPPLLIYFLPGPHPFLSDSVYIPYSLSRPVQAWRRTPFALECVCVCVVIYVCVFMCACLFVCVFVCVCPCVF